MEGPGVYISPGLRRQSRPSGQGPYLKLIGINAIVFDVKDVGGTVNYRSSLPLVKNTI
jgi:hypothetical protein